jgi:hypothetical protein
MKNIIIAEDEQQDELNRDYEISLLEEQQIYYEKQLELLKEQAEYLKDLEYEIWDLQKRQL